MWLLRQQRPDFKTIADFRKDNAKRFKGVLREFNLLCRKLHLFGAGLLSINGAKFKARNSNVRHICALKLAELIKRIDTHIEKYVDEPCIVRKPSATMRRKTFTIVPQGSSYMPGRARPKGKKKSPSTPTKQPADNAH